MLKKFYVAVLILPLFGIIVFAQTVSVKEVAKLETKITQNPADFITRFELITFYEQGKTLADKKSLQRHRLGLIENSPQNSFYQYLGLWMKDDKNKPDYLELKNGWLKQLAKYKTDSKVHLNAGDFFSLPEESLAEKLFREGEEMDSGFFLFPYRLMEIYKTAYDEMQVQADLNEDTFNAESRKTVLQKIVAETRKGIAALEKSGEPEKPEYLRKFLAEQARKSLELGDLETAKKAAVDLRQNLLETKPQFNLYEYYRILVSVLGRVELKEGNIADAKKLLFDSINRVENMDNLAPIVDTGFIQELLIKEGAADVLKYLQLCEKLTLEEKDKKIIKKWQRLLLEGKIPNFSEYSQTIENILIL